MCLLSVVVITHNMERELPRTLKSLSDTMQAGIAAEDYEIIVVDNGSRHPPVEAEMKLIARNVSVFHVDTPSRSPVSAIHLGLSAASGDLIGVWIDGARMASPGLLKMALGASKLHPNPVIGTLAFHLGPKVQMESVHEGYCQAVEDEQLATSAWESDGYRLFGISCFAGSSRGGWFALPAETNALFLPKSEWNRLDGGFDPRFTAPGGGLANLDIWRRLAEDAQNGIIMLLGEGTFHQFHGGIATNAMKSPWHEFAAEYRLITGRAYEPPTRSPLYFGNFNEHSRRFL